MPLKSWQHKVVCPQDASLHESVTFRWHWKRGVLDKRMSALELAAFLLPEMPHIVPLLSDHPVVQARFQQLLIRLATWPKDALDELCTWIKPIIAGEEDGIILLDINCREPQPRGRVYSLPGAS